MKIKNMTYDTKCHDLAVSFLADYPALDSKEAQHELACEIQQAVERWLDEAEHNLTPEK